MTPASDRFANIDALRALAALLVVVAHTAEIAITNVAAPSTLDAGIAWATKQFDFGRIGVLAFFCVSGYLIPMTLRGRGLLGALSFALRRSTRIYPAYWLSLVAILATLWFGFGNAFSPSTIAAHVTMVPIALGHEAIMGHYWTLEVELAFYVLCALVFLAGATRSATALLALSLAFLALSLVLDPRIAPRLGLGSGASAHVRVACLGLGLMFWASALRLWREDEGVATWHKALILGLGVALAVVPALLGVAFVAMGIGGDLTRQLLGTGLGVGLFLAFLRVRGAPAWVLALGRWSYSIYLFHPVPLYALYAAARSGAFGAVPAGVMIPAIVLVALITIVLAAVVYRLIEAPAMDWGHARAKAIEASAARLDAPGARP